VKKEKTVKVSMAGGWRVKDRPVITCSMIKEPNVYLERQVVDKINLLMDAYPHQEWLGYMVGTETDGDYLVNELVIPPHASASGASAEAEPMNIPDGCVGLIHSHNSMRAFHSGTDQAHVDRNYPISVTVAKPAGQIEYDTISCHRTECGKDAIVKGHIKYVQPAPTFNAHDWLEAAKAKIDKNKTTIVYGGGGYQYGPDIGYYQQTNHRIYPAGAMRIVGEEDNNGQEVLTGKDGRTMTAKEIEQTTKDIFGD
jgi:hypothetical protein